MHETHWGLRETPFRGALDPKFFHESPTHDEALARLHFLVEHRRRLALLLGDSGSGKSLLLQVFARQLRRHSCQIAALNLIGMSEHDLVWSLASALMLDPAVDAPMFSLWRSIADRLAENRYQRLSTVLLLDDADEASPEVLAQILRLLNLDPSPESRLTVVVAGKAQNVMRLGQRMVELAELRIEIEPWDESETRAYLDSSINKAGRAETVFEAPAASRLHQLGEGVPRRVRQLAELSLLAGAGHDLTQINQTTVEAAFEELSVTQPAHCSHHAPV